MWDIVFEIGSRINKLSGTLDRQTWICVFAAVMVVGLFCMRGFGSRSSY